MKNNNDDDNEYASCCFFNIRVDTFEEEKLLLMDAVIMACGGWKFMDENYCDQFVLKFSDIYFDLQSKKHKLLRKLF